MKKVIYKITINNWEKYQKNLKPHHKKIMLATNFLNDPKVRSQTLAGRLLYLSCLLLAGDSCRSQFEVSHESLCFQSGVKSSSVQSQLNSLQSFQLLSWEITSEPLEVKRKERKGSEVKRSPKGDQILKDEKTTADLIKIYCDNWRLAYRTESNPHIDAKISGQLKRFLKSVGFARGEEIVKFYLKMPDPWFIKKRHDVPTMLANINSIIQFIEKGRVITNKELANMDKSLAAANLINDIKENGI